MATYTTQNADKVERLVLYAPPGFATRLRWCRPGPGRSPPTAPCSATRRSARWLTGVPEDKKASLIPAGWFDAWADATWATDPDGAKKNPPVLRAPNGVVQDGAEFFGAGKAYYDPAKITVPTLLVLGRMGPRHASLHGADAVSAAGKCARQALGACWPRARTHHHGKEPPEVVQGGAGLPR